MTFGKWLAERREVLNLTQLQLAKRSGLSVSYISALERDEPNSKLGEPRRPRIEKVEKLAKSLGVDPDEARLAAGYAAQPRKAKTAKEALEIMEKLVPGFEGILTAEGITDENAQRILDDFLTVIELHKRRNG